MSQIVRITAELIDEGKPPEVLGQAEIVRVGPALPVCDYDWRIGLPGRPQWRHGRLKAFARRRGQAKSSVWDLLFRVLQSAVYHRNREGKS